MTYSVEKLQFLDTLKSCQKPLLPKNAINFLCYRQIEHPTANDQTLRDPGYNLQEKIGLRGLKFSKSYEKGVFQQNRPIAVITNSKLSHVSSAQIHRLSRVIQQLNSKPVPRETPPLAHDAPRHLRNQPITATAAV